MTKQHKEKRMEWVKEKVSWKLGKWMTIIFCDEKVNLNGPDGIQCHRDDLRKENKCYLKFHLVGVRYDLGAFSTNGKAELVVMEWRQNAQK